MGRGGFEPPKSKTSDLQKVTHAKIHQIYKKNCIKLAMNCLIFEFYTDRFVIFGDLVGKIPNSVASLFRQVEIRQRNVYRHCWS